MNDIQILSYEMGNLTSVSSAIKHVGGNCRIVSTAKQLCSESPLIIPGVGAFPAAMGNLTRSGLSNVVSIFLKSGAPVLGICLGMQLLFGRSFEFVETKGLGLIPGDVVRLPLDQMERDPLRIQRIPNIGWEDTRLKHRDKTDSDWWYRNIEFDKRFYYVHSMMVSPLCEDCILADYSLGGVSIPAVINYQNFLGCQFHPEKSREPGLELLRDFVFF